MKHTRIMLVLVAAMVLVLSACGRDGDSDDQQSGMTEIPELIDVQLALVPDHPKPGETVTLRATVTQGQEPVNDADEVVFEIWKEGQAEHERIDGVARGEGVYAIEKSFNEPGKYFVISHVTARAGHSMPQKTLIVEAEASADVEGHQSVGHGDHASGHKETQPDDTSGEAANEGSSDHHHADDAKHDSSDNTEASGHEHHHHGSGLVYHLMPIEPKADQAATLTVHIQQDGQPLDKAKVRFQLWQKAEDVPTMIEASETHAGEYQAKHTFPAAGTFQFMIHVEKGELHEHQQQTIEVSE